MKAVPLSIAAWSGLRRRALLLLGSALVVAGASAQPVAPEAPKKVLRYAFRIAETGFDPAQVIDLYSRIVISNIFEAPLEFEFMAEPARLRPNTLAAMPQVSEDHTTFTLQLRPGQYFADDKAFGGQRRELTAQDYVYALKRHYDPRWKSPQLYLLENAKILGLSELRKQAIDRKQPFDYDREVAGLKALDRYTFRIQLAEPSPRFLYELADASLSGAVAREVVEAYGDEIMAHPVGTGPFKLVSWQRSNRIVLERNAGWREVRYEEHPPAGNARLTAIARQLQGRRLPMVDRVEIAIVEENQPRWLSYLAGSFDLLEELPPEYADLAIPNNQLAPHLARKGMAMVRYPRADASLSYFNMEHPVIGGILPRQVALRRAMSLALNVEEEIRLVRGGQAVPAQSPIAPMTWGYDPAYKSEMGDHDPARAKALLDLYGYRDVDGDGWREQPDGQPLEIEYATQPDQQSRKLIELWEKNMREVGIRMRFKTAKWPENLKAARAGQLMMWGVGWSATRPDGDTFLALGYVGNKGSANLARFDLPAFNRLYERQRTLPDGPERAAEMARARDLMVVYVPYKIHLHRIFTDLAQPWLIGYHRNIFVRDFWKYVDIDPVKQSEAVR
ncbi:ABC transporter substrate-binding protein [Aquincola tertiaricarbonis]|uniref:ABC transporter substrate-binding protein n=1 Tax=Aquincola tertiaricarbonis TaxID=391953 RepID=A0ABY4SD46_AQUTE|nr:ABC transporter substrate-binding protein [Aquincola tertiaricarbonis]URI10404.1 ABC transporter substrate-binding protein [Aquincola tertiaricarbonis]